MTNIEVFVLMAVIFALYFLGLYIDKQYDLRVIDWLEGKCSNPWKIREPLPEAETVQAKKEQEISLLKARIEVLEKIVTEPAFELNQKINTLK
jgi:hypothetical protein